MAPHNETRKPRQKPKLHYNSNIIPKSSRRVNIAELVYGFLSDLAIKDAERKGTIHRRLGKRDLTIIKKPSRPRRKIVQKPQGANIASEEGNAFETTDELLNSTSPRPQLETAPSNDLVKSRNNRLKTTSSKVKKKERAMKRSMMQMINKYIKTGFEEGKRQAKVYIKKALSLAVDKGYLIPTDREGKEFKVSEALTGFTLTKRRANAEARKKRRSLRRGEDQKNKKRNDRKLPNNQKEPQKRAGSDPKTTEEKKTKETKPTSQKRESSSKSKSGKDKKELQKICKQLSNEKRKRERRSSKSSRESVKSNSKSSGKNTSDESDNRRSSSSNDAMESYVTALQIKDEPSSDRERFSNDDNQNFIPYIN